MAFALIWIGSPVFALIWIGSPAFALIWIGGPAFDTEECFARTHSLGKSLGSILCDCTKGCFLHGIIDPLGPT